MVYHLTWKKICNDLFCHLPSYFDLFSFFLNLVCVNIVISIQKLIIRSFFFINLHKVSFFSVHFLSQFTLLLLQPYSLYIPCSFYLKFQPGSHFQLEANFMFLQLLEHPEKSINILSSFHTQMRMILYYVSSHSISFCPEAHPNENRRA